MAKAAKEGHLDVVRQYKDLGATNYDEALLNAAKGGHLEIVRQCKEWGATDFDQAMIKASWEGHLEIVRQCKEWGATKYETAMGNAARAGQLDIVRQCKEWGASNFDKAIVSAAANGRLEVMQQFKEWGATNYGTSMSFASWAGHLDIVRQCYDWGATTVDASIQEATKRGHTDIVRYLQQRRNNEATAQQLDPQLSRYNIDQTTPVQATPVPGAKILDDIKPPVPCTLRSKDDKRDILVMIVDRSGSMEDMHNEVHTGCNAYIQQCIQDNTTSGTFTTVFFTCFDHSVDLLHNAVPLDALPPITVDDVEPRGSTALFDAIGCTLRVVETHLQTLPYVPKVTVFILTDGEDNGSMVWTKSTVARQIKRLEQPTHGWEFYFAAANQDAMQVGPLIGMHAYRCVSYAATPEGSSQAFSAAASARGRSNAGQMAAFSDTERAACTP